MRTPERMMRLKAVCGSARSLVELVHFGIDLLALASIARMSATIVFWFVQTIGIDVCYREIEDILFCRMSDARSIYVVASCALCLLALHESSASVARSQIF